MFFKPSANKKQIDELINDRLNLLLIDRFQDYFSHKATIRANYQVARPDANSGYIAKIQTNGIARHPAQLYESISCVILFVVLLLLWLRARENLVPGRLFSIFLIWCFGMRFLFEFLKEVQEPFEKGLPINMGQILSIPLVLAGIGILIYTFRKKEIKNT